MCVFKHLLCGISVLVCRCSGVHILARGRHVFPDFAGEGGIVIFFGTSLVALRCLVAEHNRVRVYPHIVDAELQLPLRIEAEHVAFHLIIVSIRDVDVSVVRVDSYAVGCMYFRSVGDEIFALRLSCLQVEYFNGGGLCAVVEVAQVSQVVVDGEVEYFLIVCTNHLVSAAVYLYKMIIALLYVCAAGSYIYKAVFGSLYPARIRADFYLLCFGKGSQVDNGNCVVYSHAFPI